MQLRYALYRQAWFGTSTKCSWFLLVHAVIARDNCEQSYNFSTPIAAPSAEQARSFDLNSGKQLQKHDQLVELCRTTILPVYMYGCETWSFTVGEERRLRVFGPKRVGMTGEWRRLHYE
jgi:hypothetical protein